MRAVECHSGIEYAERPTAFRWQRERRMVERIVSEQVLPDGKRFVVADDRGDCFTLTYESLPDRWRVKPAQRNP
jgi:hypothetical protein